MRDKFNNGNDFYTYNFKDFHSIWCSLIFLQMGASTPDIFLNPFINKTIVTIIICFNTFINLYIIQGVMLALVNGAFFQDIDQNLYSQVYHDIKLKK